MYYLSVDGGGSKTAILLTDEMGNIVIQGRTDGCSYPQVGIKGVYRTIWEKLEQLLNQCARSKSEIQGAAFGLPCFGEDKQADALLREVITDIVPSDKAYICNDVELGWAGSMGMEPGIHVVSGTGAIVFGRDRHQQNGRANGWHEDFSDEGSGYWLGLRLLSLFARQADGRMEQTPLYRLTQEAMGIESGYELVARYSSQYQGNRKKIASLQNVLFKAAAEGDVNALKLYQNAAWELASGIKAVAGRLDFEDNRPIAVSYSGGVFEVGEYILSPLMEYLKETRRFELRKPQMDPVRGGILLAVQLKEPKSVMSVKEVLGRGSIG